jgi:hypothetical protein
VDDERMADHKWPLEGHFVVGGSGLSVHADCLGRTFTSRTARYDLTIGLPQLDTSSLPLEVQRLLDTPPVPNLELIPPVWAYGPRDEHERAEERHISPVWGAVFGVGAKKVYPESAKNAAVVYRCRFYTTLIASDDEEFKAAAEDFLSEFDDWWTRFTSWVGILTSQDFVGLGGNPRGALRSWPLFTWTCDSTGQRTNVQFRSYFAPNQGVPMAKLQWDDLQACVSATGNQDPPPAEWLFIRDARSLLNAGQSRRAVLDAGTAAELAMTTLIDKHLDDTNADEGVRNAIARGYRNLGAKKTLVGLLRPGLLSDRVQPDLIDKRDTAIHGRSKAGHGWDEVTFEQAHTAVDLATEIVELAHPLAELLPGAQST